MARPQGVNFASHTKTLKIDGFCDFQLHPSHIGEPMEQREPSCLARLAESRQRSTIGQGLVRVDVSFGSFSLRQRK